MKICHMCTGYPLSFQGGITNYVRALADSQQAIGNDVCVVSNISESGYDYHVKHYLSKKIRPFATRPLEDKESLEELKAFFEEQQFDLIHIHMVLDVDWDLYEVLKHYHYVVSLHDYFYLCPRIVMLPEGNPPCGNYDEKRCSNCISWFNTSRIFNSVEYRIKKHLGLKNFAFPFIPQNMTKKKIWKIQEAP